MTEIMKSEIFFFISSIGFVVLTVLLSILIVYVIRTIHTWKRILDKLEDNIGDMGDTAKDMLEDVRDSTWFRFFAGKRKRSKK